MKQVCTQEQLGLYAVMLCRRLSLYQVVGQEVTNVDEKVVLDTMRSIQNEYPTPESVDEAVVFLRVPGKWVRRRDV